MTHRCLRPHRVAASIDDGGTLRRASLEVGVDLRVKIIERTSKGFVRLQPVGDPGTVLKVAHVVFARNWEAVG